MKFLHTMVRARNLDDTLNFFCDQLGLVEVNRYASEAGRFTLVSLAAWQASKLLRGHAHEISAHHGAGTES